MIGQSSESPDPQLAGELVARPVPAGLQQGQQPQRPGTGVSHISIITQLRPETGRYRP